MVGKTFRSDTILSCLVCQTLFHLQYSIILVVSEVQLHLIRIVAWTSVKNRIGKVCHGRFSFTDHTTDYSIEIHSYISCSCYCWQLLLLMAGRPSIQTCSRLLLIISFDCQLHESRLQQANLFGVSHTLSASITPLFAGLKVLRRDAETHGWSVCAYGV